MKNKKFVLFAVGLLLVIVIGISAGFVVGKNHANKSNSKVDGANNYLESIASTPVDETSIDETVDELTVESESETEVQETEPVEETSIESVEQSTEETTVIEETTTGFVYENENYAVPDELPTGTTTSDNPSNDYASEDEIIATFDGGIRGLCLSAFDDEITPLQDLNRIIREAGFLYPTPYMIADGSYYADNEAYINFMLPGCRANAVITRNGSMYTTTFRILDPSEYTEEVG